MPGVRECCVFGIRDDYWGERIEAAVVADRNIEAASVIAFLKQKLGSIRTPKALHFVDELPRNAVGKVVRRDLADLFA
jgi:acyl-coenzyme A synthetase/AMP-(fatty) acid ligase